MSAGPLHHQPRLFRSDLTGRVYLTTVWRDLGNGQVEAVTKQDVTDDFERLFKHEFERLFDENGAEILAIQQELRQRLLTAQAGLRRALDYRAATPEGLAIKADIRKALVLSGDPGPWGAGSPTSGRPGCG